LRLGHVAEHAQKVGELLVAFDSCAKREAMVRSRSLREYMDIRGQVAKVRGNREKALLSHISNKAGNGATRLRRTLAKGFEGFRETGRDR
jgi:hypothetical protein